MKTINANSEFTNLEHYTYNFSTAETPANNYKVNDCVINFNFQLIDTKHYRQISFTNCTFLKTVTFRNVSIYNNFDFHECKFLDTLTLENVIIKGKARFWRSEFASLSINNLRFENLADFFKTQFFKKTIFYKTDFLGTTVFTASCFKENVLFTYSKIADAIIFSRTNFEKGLDLSQAIITGTIKNSNSDFGVFSNEKDLIDDDEYRKSFEEYGIITLNNKRETFRILKKAALADSNQFKFLEYSKLENQTYFEQLKSAWYKRLDNYLIFLLNKASNNHNMSWSRGVLFTAIVGFIFYYFSLINTIRIEFGWDSNLFYYYLGQYFLFLSPVHEKDLFKNEIMTPATIIFDFLGRIFLSYGIYQTVQAFRKHRG